MQLEQCQKVEKLRVTAHPFTRIRHFIYMCRDRSVQSHAWHGTGVAAPPSTFRLHHNKYNITCFVEGVLARRDEVLCRAEYSVQWIAAVDFARRMIRGTGVLIY